MLPIVIAVLIWAFFAFDLSRYLTFDYIRQQQSALAAFHATHPVLTICMYMGIYILASALSLPGAVIITLAGGALFGLVLGAIVVSFASTIGATLAFLASRFLLRNWVQHRFGNRLKAINDGMRKDGMFYLFTLRLIPIFPFFIINLVMGVTTIKTIHYYWVSQLGMLAGTVVYVNAGTQLARLESPQGILSPGLLLSFALLGIFPLAAKKTVQAIKHAKSKNHASV